MGSYLKTSEKRRSVIAFTGLLCIISILMCACASDLEMEQPSTSTDAYESPESTTVQEEPSTIAEADAQSDTTAETEPLTENTVEAVPDGLYLDQNTLSLNAGEVYGLQITWEPEYLPGELEVRWSSTDETVAVVDDQGRVTAIGAGSCSITAVCGTLSALCEVHVLVPMTGIVLSQQQLDLKTGESVSLTVDIMPADTTDSWSAAWSSDNPSVASVSQEGTVTAVSGGTAVISVSVGNFTASCPVSVTENIPAETTVTGRVVVLDPGHGGKYDGAYYFGRHEEDMSLKVGQFCKEYLEEHYSDVTVYLTRTDDTHLSEQGEPDREARVQFAKDRNADILVSLHFNVTPEHNASGCLAFISKEANVNAACTSLANSILARLSALGLQNLGTFLKDSDTHFDASGRPYDYYGINRHSAKWGFPGIIIEHCFMDNPADEVYIADDGALQRLAIADALGIADYLGLTAK